LGVQQVQSLDGEWEVPNTFSDDEQEVASGAKALNQGHVNWYFIPPKPSIPSLPARRLDASGAVAGDPNSPKWGMSPLVLDHVFTEDKTGKQAWANVHAFDHGELLTGQMRLVHKKRYVPPPPPPEKDVDLDGVLHGVLDEVSHTHTHTFTNTHAHMNTDTHTQTHTHTHTHATACECSRILMYAVAVRMKSSHTMLQCAVHTMLQCEVIDAY